MIGSAWRYFLKNNWPLLHISIWFQVFYRLQTFSSLVCDPTKRRSAEKWERFSPAFPFLVLFYGKLRAFSARGWGWGEQILFHGCFIQWRWRLFSIFRCLITWCWLNNYSVLYFQFCSCQVGNFPECDPFEEEEI